MTTMLVGCDNKNDCVTINNKSELIFDDVKIGTPSGYFYKSHEKFTVDNDTIAVTIYFSTDIESWE